MLLIKVDVFFSNTQVKKSFFYDRKRHLNELTQNEIVFVSCLVNRKENVMNDMQMCLIIALLIVSVLVLLIPLSVSFIRKIRKPSDEVYKKAEISRMMAFSVCLIISIWCLRYAVGYFEIISSDKIVLTWWEEIFDSMSHTLQTFSMDEEYSEYIIKGKLMLCKIFGENTVWKNIYGIYASVLNFIAPIVGGAIIFEILTSIFPKIRLYISNAAFWREKYYFSELNEESLSLAKSVCNARKGAKTRPVIIFTDAYIDNSEEKDSEMLLEAKSMGAICVRDDLTHIKKSKFGFRKIFLVDEDESGNLKTLTDLANENNSFFLKNAEIFLFTDDDAYVQVERQVRDKLILDFNFSEQELPLFEPIQSYRNLIYNLLVDIPLFDPLIGKEKKSDGTQDLTVTILGTGHIGIEMFLAAYWFGQLLDCNLNFNILSQETEEAFWNKIDYINPEIKHTTIMNDPILRVNRKGDYAPVYCNVNYVQCDVKSTAFVDCLNDYSNENNILGTDYFLVSIGSDEDNISVANTIKKYIGQHHISTNSSCKTIVAYVVYDSDLSKALNRTNLFCSFGETADILMRAVGSRDEVYGERNVFLKEYEPLARKLHEAYLSAHGLEPTPPKHKNTVTDDYNHWADLSRGMHLKYKMFSMGVINTSLFDFESIENYKEAIYSLLDKYIEIASQKAEFRNKNDANVPIALLHKMAWLEHRRWNAFTRVMGFRHTNDYDIYAIPGKFGSYKQMDIKLHPCLVECDQKGIRASINAKGEIDKKTLFKCADDSDFDLLDDISYDLHKKRYNDFDFKQFDYPISDLYF